MEKRFFTVKEARQLLPFLKETVGRAITLSSQLREQQDVVQSLSDSAANNTGSPEGTAYLETLIQLQDCLHQIQNTGCIIKSVEEGLRTIFEDGHQNNIIDKMQTRKRLYDLVEYEKYNTLDEKIYNFSSEGHE